MVGSKELEDNNKIVRNLAASSSGSMNIDQLLSQPSYCGFVEGVVFEDLRLVMLLIDSDDGVALRWLWNHAYEPMSLALWSLMARDSEVVLDIGAHTGVYSLSASLANDKATVVSFEPYWLNLSRLAANLRVNGLKPENIFSGAVSDKDGVMAFNVESRFGYHSTGGVIGASSDSGSIQVQTIQIDTLYHQQKFAADLVKIDVEGHEPNVLKSMTNVLGECAPDIFIEAVDPNAAEECTNILQGHGYRFFCIDDEGMTVERVDLITPVLEDGLPDMARLNRLATKKSHEEINLRTERVREEWRAAEHLR